LVIVRGAGGNFSSGYDMEEFSISSGPCKTTLSFRSDRETCKPAATVICAIQGHCSTGSLELALAADLIVASESAQFTDAYARWGLTPIWGLSLRLPHRVGTAKASEMMLTCRTYTGRQAEEMHLANLCFADDRFEAELARLSADILGNSWYANQVNKRALVASDKLPLREAHA